MLNNITSALSRRNLLLGLAASATAATSTGAKGSSAAPQENPALLALADELPEIAGAYKVARDEVDQIVKAWSPSWPVPAEEVFSYGSGSKTHRGIDGEGIKTTRFRDMSDVYRLGTPEMFAENAKGHEKRIAEIEKTKSKRRMEFHQLHAGRDRAAIEPARAYWSEVDRITKASGIEAATAKREAALESFREQVDKIMGTEDWTITGAVIKAQALAAWGEVDRFMVIFNARGHVWAKELSSSILRHASAA